MCRFIPRRVMQGTVAAFLLLAMPAVDAGIAFQANYTDSANEGFKDATLGAQRTAAFEYALDIWEGALANSYSGETIVIDASFDNTLGSTTLGGASPTALHQLDTGSSKYSVTALANHKSGVDKNGGTSEGSAVFNGDSAISWYYGTDANGQNTEYDFVTVVLHEIGHVLGFYGLLENDGNYLEFPTAGQYIHSDYDAFVQNGAGTSLLSLTPAQRLTAATSGDIYWAGAEAFATNGNVKPKLYAPTTWAQGSTYSHLDETTFANELMSPSISAGETIHTISDLTIAMLVDMGWTAAVVPEPGTLAIWGVLLVTSGLARRRRSATFALSA